MTISIFIENAKSINTSLISAKKELSKSSNGLQTGVNPQATPTGIYTASIAKKDEKTIENQISVINKTDSMLSTVTNGIAKISDSITDASVIVDDVRSTTDIRQQIVKLESLIENIKSTDNIASQIEFDGQKLIYKPYVDDATLEINAFTYSYSVDLEGNRDSVTFMNLEQHQLFGKITTAAEPTVEEYLTTYINGTITDMESLLEGKAAEGVTQDSINTKLDNIKNNIDKGFDKVAKERLTQESKLQSVGRNLSPMESSLANAQETYNRYMQVDTVAEIANINDQSNALGLNLYLFEVDRDNSKQIVRSLASS